jgi:hypothetical protein
MSSKTDRIVRRVKEYVDLCERCFVCWWGKHIKSWERTLEVHHICGRGRGMDYWDARNLGLICRRCHSDHHQGHSERPLPLSVVLLCKEQEDGEVDLAFLSKLRNRAALKEDPATELPQWIVEERAKNERLLKARAPFLRRSDDNG